MPVPDAKEFDSLPTVTVLRSRAVAAYFSRSIWEIGWNGIWVRRWAGTWPPIDDTPRDSAPPRPLRLR